MGKQEATGCLLRATHHIVHYLGRRDSRFSLVGSSTELKAMAQYAEEFDVSDFVTFCGRIPSSELIAMLNTADVCVNPDVTNEMIKLSAMNKVFKKNCSELMRPQYY